jgi:hypothetical protein
MSACLRGLALFMCIATACGKAVEPSSRAPDAGGEDGSDDGGTTIDAGDDGRGADAGGPARKARIIASTANFTDATGAPVRSSFARAWFGDFQGQDCTTVLQELECSVVDCIPVPASPPYPEAGLIVIQVNTIDSATLTPAMNGVYNAYGASSLLFPDGAQLAVFAAGDEVPAFDIDLVAPSSIGFQGGVPTSSTPLAISAAAGHDMSWGGVEPTDTVRVTLTALPDTDQVTRRVDCSLAAGVGRLFLSSAVLSLMPRGELAFEARVQTSGVAAAGDHEVTFIAQVVARTGDSAADDWARGTTTLGE